MAEKEPAKLQLWGGVECTVNRIQDLYLDQLKWNGHEERIEDLELFASLGIKTLRYPFLWEKIAPKENEERRWNWAEQRIQKMKSLGITPIVGLLHHGSGPASTSLIDREFPEKLAAYASAFAQRFPELKLYTPINEPLTTARFSALYGFWYPHARDNRLFLRAFLNQCRAICLAMKAIRSFNPEAQLIQTEDLGKAQSTPLLKYQADFENERRWLSFDTLCGRLNPQHALWQNLLSWGATEKELHWFSENPCPPHLLGINHYPLSNRYLDEKVENYPAKLIGGNGKHRYADAEAIRVANIEPIYLDTLLMETWARYKVPIAITEAHIDCTREEQMRWLLDFWSMAESARAQGADIRALTVWGLLGHYDWHCLLTKCEGYYESGVFDVRSGTPRPTALARLVRELANHETPNEPYLSLPGWWRRDIRLLYPLGAKLQVLSQNQDTELSSTKTKPLVIVGRGTLGRAFAKICELRGLPYQLLGRLELDITNETLVRQKLEALRPWALVNAAGYVRVDAAQNEIETCFKENLIGAVNLARASAHLNTPFLSFSSDLVFDGKSLVPYKESSPVSPLNVYGQSKAQAEKEILKIHPEAIVVRTSAFFGPWDEANFIHQSLQQLRKGEVIYVSDKQRVSPTYVPHLVNASLDLLLDRTNGIWHLANVGEVSWHEFAQQAAEHVSLDTSKILPAPVPDLRWIAPRPSFSVLSSERGILLPKLENALESYFKEINL